MNRMYAAAAALAAAAAVSAAAPPASADLTPTASVRITWSGTTATICAKGHDDDGTTQDQWVFTVTAVRDGVPYAPTPVMGSGPTFAPPCTSVSRLGTLSGAIHAQVLYAAAATTSGPGLAGAEEAWSPANAPTGISWGTNRGE